MKVAIIILIVLGLLAAASAAVLVGTLHSSRTLNSAPSGVAVVLAAQALPAASVLTSTHITEGTALKKDLRDGYISSPVQAIGRILAVPVVEGQVLTESCFVSEGSGAQLAAALPAGMRAASVTLTQGSIAGGLLYPGCIVDVLASFRLSSSARGEAISTTLLRGITVLAIEGASVVSKNPSEQNPGLNSRRTASTARLTVTLMVDSKQAEALQLAMQYGSISLAMRNPLDKRPTPPDATLLSQGRLATLGSALDPKALIAQHEAGLLQEPLTDTNDLMIWIEEGIAGTVQQAAGSEAAAYQNISSEKLSWLVTVIRGQQVEEKEFDMPEEELATETEAKE